MKITLALMTLLVSASAFATSPIAPPAPKIQDVTASLTLDMNSDGFGERALLIDDKNGNVDLYVYSTTYDQKTSKESTKLIARKAQIAWNGNMWGQEASLQLNTKGSLQIHSQNEASRDSWSSAVTLVMRNGEVVVAGLDYRYMDKFDIENSARSCSINFLSGSVFDGNKASKIPAGGLSLSKFDVDKTVSDVCKIN